MNELQALRAELNIERRARKAAETELVFVTGERDRLALRAKGSENEAERAERLLRTTTDQRNQLLKMAKRLEEERAAAQEDAERQRERVATLEEMPRLQEAILEEVLRRHRAWERLVYSNVALIEQAAKELERLDKSPTTGEKSDWRRLLYAAVNDIKARNEP